MIFPLLGGIFSVRYAPVTWMLFVINLYVMIVTFPQAEKAQSDLQIYLRDRVFTSLQGKYFAEFVRNHPDRYPATIQHLAKKSAGESSTRDQLMGGIALRDSLFMAEAPNEEFPGDSVSRKWWLEKHEVIQEIKETHPSYLLGLTSDNHTWLECLTYQFSHAGVGHFVGNMIFFLIFATNIEVVLGGLTVLCLYLLSGVFAALAFLLMNDASAIPLIGASGSISGIMAFSAIAFWGRGYRYLYFLFVPKRGFAGTVFLPVWITLILWAVSDLAGYLSSPHELSGVAYSAHLGGEVCGILFGLLAWSFARLRGEPLVGDHPMLETQPILTKYS